jgi:hypothetical protein
VREMQSTETARYRANLQAEVDGAALYRVLADAAPRPDLAAALERLTRRATARLAVSKHRVRR